ncbi:MAG: hypothetical protein HY268_11140 [Deltaproteobacteria bacterium]|nr:hypothetical protein [Deltaproteobacteria bacterium]
MGLHLVETLKALHIERKKETLKKGWGEVPSWVFINAVGNPSGGPGQLQKTVVGKDPEHGGTLLFPDPLTPPTLRL